jgi:hypothetical protein
MDESFKTILVLLSGMVVILAVFLLIAGNIYPDGVEMLGITPESSYSYEVSLTSSETLYNVTLFLPLPSDFGYSAVGYGILNGSGYGIPDNMATDIFGEGDSLFLKVTLPETDGLKFGINVDNKVLIDTVDPVLCSYVIRPVMDLQSGESTDTYKTYIYASYDASPGAVVTIDISEEGRNTWKVFSEKTNYFDEHVSLSLTKSPGKWEKADVSLSKENGDYSVLF